MLQRIVLFLVGAIADFFTFILLARFLMQAFRVSFANSIGETVVGLTNWAVKPLRRVIPSLFGLDTASLIPAWLLQVLLLLLSLLLRAGDGVDYAAMLPAVLAAGAVDTLRVGIYVLIVALIAAAIVSWVNPYSPMAGPVIQLSRPLLRPVQRVIPPLSNIDLSPLVVILLLQVVLMLLDAMKDGVLSVFLR